MIVRETTETFTCNLCGKKKTLTHRVRATVRRSTTQGRNRRPRGWWVRHFSGECVCDDCRRLLKHERKEKESGKRKTKTKK